jgi:uncharacterized protein
MRAIRKFARQVAERFRPASIILFGSCASGASRQDSDVDILVVLPCRDRIAKAVDIRWEFPTPFPMDLIVRTPRQLAEGIRGGDAFLKDIISSGKVLYEATDSSLRQESGRRLRAGSGDSSRRQQAI